MAKLSMPQVYTLRRLAEGARMKSFSNGKMAREIVPGEQDSVSARSIPALFNMGLVECVTDYTKAVSSVYFWLRLTAAGKAAVNENKDRE